MRFLTTAIILLISTCSYAKSHLPAAITTPIQTSELAEFADNSSSVKTLIKKAEKLSRLNLTYEYGSADPKNKGMDCSGTIHYLLSSSSDHKIIPRSSNDLFNWIERKGKLHKVSSVDIDSRQFNKLKPGDLLFWSGTYKTSAHISHVMMYLGKNKEGERVMFGASNGRYYQGKKRWGVSIFDFVLPTKKQHAKFIGYSCIPDITC